MTLEEALAAIKVLEADKGSLEAEKAALLKKREQLLGELKEAKEQVKKFLPYQDLDIEGLVKAKTEAENQINSTKTELQKAQDAQLAEIRKIKADLENERARLIAEREAERAGAEQAKIDAAIVNVLAEAKAISPEQLLAIAKTKFKFILDPTGSPVVDSGIREIALREWAEGLTQDKNYQYHFSPPSASGSGSPAGSAAKGSAGPNPWKTGNLTEQCRIVTENPVLAARLKLEAGKK